MKVILVDSNINTYSSLTKVPASKKINENGKKEDKSRRRRNGV